MLPYICMFIILLYNIHLFLSQKYVFFLQTTYTLLLYIILNRSYQPKAYTSFKNQEFKNFCKVCNNSKPPRYYHCRRCQLCIYRMDHHCEWFGCCIGQFNGKIYLQALINIILMSIFYIIDRTSIWMWNIWHFLLLILAIFSIYEGGRLLRDYINSVKTNQTLIESYKQVRGRKHSKIKLWRQIMGQLGINWILPTYTGLKFCSFSQQIVKIDKNIQIKQHTYADDYLYGVDDEDEKKHSQ